MKTRRGLNGKKQTGTVLIVSLVLLLVLTILGLSGMQASGLQERMAGNLHDASLAFLAAEAALREGERLVSSPVLPEFENRDGLYVYAPTESDYDSAIPVWRRAGWSWDQARAYQGSLQNRSAAPRYVIEELPRVLPPGASAAADEPLPDQAVYRITARARGGSDASEVILQSIYMR